MIPVLATHLATPADSHYPSLDKYLPCQPMTTPLHDLRFDDPAAGIVTAPAAQAQAQKAAEASFSRQVLPILKASCLKCHDAKNKKGGFDL